MTSEKRAGSQLPAGNLGQAALEELQLEKLRALLSEILPANRFYAKKLAAAGLRDAAAIRTLDDLRRLPFTSKAELQEDQERQPPFGTNLSYPIDRYTRLHQTSGSRGRPIRWLDTPESWESLMDAWRTIFAAAGLAPPDRLFFPFSFGPFLAFWAAFDGAARLGMMAIPGGGLTSSARLKLLLENGAAAVLATPTYALRLLEVAEEEGIRLPGGPVKVLIVAGEPGGSIPAVRERLESGWGARVFDHWGMTEVGPLAFEAAEAPGELLVLETLCIPEVIDPRTGERAASGERGELCITTLERKGSPVIRYRTGDLVEACREPLPSGAACLRLRGGILGRLDDMILVKGNNVYPSAIEAVLRRIAGLSEYQVEVYRSAGAAARLRLLVEPARGADSAGLVQEVRDAIQLHLNFRPDVAAAAAGSLPRFELKADRFVYREERTS